MISAVLAGLYYYGMYDKGVVQTNKIANAKTQEKKLKLQLEKAVESEENAKKYKILEEELGDKLEKIIRYIPYELGDADIMSLISNSAKFVGASISSLQSSGSGGGGSFNNGGGNGEGANEKQFLEKINIQVSLEATYSQILLFLSELTRADRIINPDSISLSVSNSSGRSNGNVSDTESFINFTGTFVAYRYKVDEESDNDEYLQGLPGYQEGGLVPGGGFDPSMDPAFGQPQGGF